MAQCVQSRVYHDSTLPCCLAVGKSFWSSFLFCIFTNTAPTFYCQDWNTKQIFTLFWVSCSNDVHERTSQKIFLSLSTGCFTLVWMFVNGSALAEQKNYDFVEISLGQCFFFQFLNNEIHNYVKQNIIVNFWMMKLTII